jgi:GTP cyclohydrolase I
MGTSLTVLQGPGMDLAAAERAAVEAEHMCMTLRGVRAAGTTTTTSSVRDDPRSRAKFLALTTGGRHG